MIALKSTNNLEASYLGCLDYEASVAMQQNLMCMAQNTGAHYVIGLEHPAVLTLGYRAEIAEEIIHAELPVVRSTRGGLATIHSEGQLVIYPVLNLRSLHLGVRDYVMLLLQTTQDLLKHSGIESFIDDKAVGIYTKQGKIAFCGVQVKNGISQHGLSLNVRNDLSLFTGIRACGLINPQFDSMAAHGNTRTLGELYTQWISFFKIRLEKISQLQ